VERLEGKRKVFRVFNKYFHRKKWGEKCVEEGSDQIWHWNLERGTL